MSATSTATGVAWDLSDLYRSYDDPQIAADISQIMSDAEAFAITYRNTINVPGGPDAAHLYAALERLEALHDKLGRVLVYAHLLFAADTSKPEYRNLLQQIDQHETAMRNMLLFFELEWLAVPAEDAQRVIDQPSLEPYRHHLQAMRRYQPHTLTEPEERIINEKNMTGSQAWQKLFTELLASLMFPIELDGELQTLDLDTMLNKLLRSPERDTRRQAFTSIFTVLGSQKQSLAFIYNTLWQDHLTMNRLRHYDDPMAPRHLANQIDGAAVATMMDVVEQNYDIAHTYFKLKAKLLKLPTLQIYDQYAPVGNIAATQNYAYPQAREVILQAMSNFDRGFRDIAADFFTKNWIDAEIRPGKRGGAFCNGYPPSNHPYILCNYTDNLNDAMTLAHELGHGIHFALARKQTLFNFHPSLPLAETASVFGEMLVFEYLLNQQQDQQTKLALVCKRIEDTFATVFRQNVLTRFEQAVFEGCAQGRLSPEQISEYWLAANSRYYDGVVEQTEGYELGWSYIPHFIHTPFYCYSYVFGVLLVMALYDMYREQGTAFVPHYISLLEAGGSRSPDELLTELGVDMRDPAFWQRGLTELRRLVGWAQDLATV